MEEISATLACNSSEWVFDRTSQGPQHKRIGPPLRPDDQLLAAIKAVIAEMQSWQATRGENVEGRMAGEEAARKDLAKEWPKIPSAERTQCTGTVAVGGSPSHLELLICVEMLSDSRKRRGEEQGASKAKKPITKSP